MKANLRTLPAFFPLLLLGSIYGSWFLAWVVLGHAPRPSLDDPKETLGVIYLASVLVVAIAPFGFTAGFCCAANLVLEGGRWRFNQLSLPLAFICFWAGSIFLLRSDPWNAVNWWMD